MSKDQDDDDNVTFENLEKWKQFENMEFSRGNEREKFKARARTAEDQEIDSCTFEWLDALFKSKNLEILNMEETKREIYLAQKLNERHIKLQKENEAEYCTFFMKTGACKYGMQCKRTHIVPLASETILIDHMYKDSYNKKNMRGFDDSVLEVDQEEVQKKYEEFYDDVFPEWSRFGKIVQFKCCNNPVSHLRGHVFIQYENVESAILAKANLDGRFYGGYSLRVSFSLIKDWKQALCAYNGPTSCPKFSECNFLHAYKNPRNEFPFERRSPERGGRGDRGGYRGDRGGYRGDRGSYRGGGGQQNYRRRSRSPQDRHYNQRRRSRSREKDYRRSDRRDSRDRDDYKRRDRDRSGSRDRKHHRKEERKRSRSRERRRSPS